MIKKHLQLQNMSLKGHGFQIYAFLGFRLSLMFGLPRDGLYGGRIVT